MAKKGQPRRQKRLSIGTVRYLKRKEAVWTIRQKPGPHSTPTGVPLGFIVRDMLGIGKTLREARRVLGNKSILVNNIPRTMHQFTVGLFDTITVVPTKKNYRVMLDQKGRMVLSEINEKLFGWKPAKVTIKKRIKGNKILVQTHDGYTYSETPAPVEVGGSVIVSSDGKITESLPLRKGTKVFVIGGTHVGEIATVNTITDGTMRRSKMVSLSEGSEKFQTTARNVMVIDNETAAWLKKNNSPAKEATA